MVGTPFRSGLINREQGISKAGNKRVRSMAVQIALGLAHLPTTECLDAVVHGAVRSRRAGRSENRIVAVARRVVIDLWRYLDAGVVPEGAVFNDPVVATRGR
jgi:transposase